MPAGAIRKVTSSASELDSAAMSTTASQAAPIAPEMTDLLRGARLYVRFIREHNQWYAEAIDYRIVGIGSSRAEAMHSMLRTLEAYLRHERKQGHDAQQARRFVDRRTAIEVRALALVSRLVPREHRRALRLRLSA